MSDQTNQTQAQIQEQPAAETPAPNITQSTEPDPPCCTVPPGDPGPTT